MTVSPEDLLVWLTIKEKIEKLKNEQRSIGAGITSLQRCQDDFGNVSTTFLKYAKGQAAYGIEQICGEIKELQEKKEEIESRVAERLK